MPDRTQTLSGLERFITGAEVVESSTPAMRKLEVSRMLPSEDGDWIRYDDVVALLSQPEQGHTCDPERPCEPNDHLCRNHPGSQPEHQGDDPELREQANRIWAAAERLGPGADATELKACSQALHRLAAKAQPPAPVLSDEERERLAGEYERLGAMASDPAHTSIWNHAADLLRKLASQEHRGKLSRRESELLDLLKQAEGQRDKARREREVFASKEIERIAQYMDLADCLFSRQQIKAASDDDLHAALKSQLFKSRLQPPAGEVESKEREELTMIALALYNQGIEDCTPERGVELLVERLYAQRGEVGRLRERLEAEIEERRGWAAEHRDLAAQTTDDQTGEIQLAQARRIDDNTDRLQALLVSPPSDSQGDQERCNGKTRTEREADLILPAAASDQVYPRDIGPDCSPAPTHSKPGWLERSLDEAHQRIQMRPEHLKPEGYEAPTQVEGDDETSFSDEDNTEDSMQDGS